MVSQHRDCIRRKLEQQPFVRRNSPLWAGSSLSEQIRTLLKLLRPTRWSLARHFQLSMADHGRNAVFCGKASVMAI